MSNDLPVSPSKPHVLWVQGVFGNYFMSLASRQTGGIDKI